MYKKITDQNIIIQYSYEFVFTAFYNKTSLVRPEFRSDFNHQVSIVSYYNLFAKPEFIDVIGEKVLNEYFPCEEMSDDTHTEAVQVKDFLKR